MKGVFDLLFERLSGDRDFEYAMIDGTIVRVHQQGTGAMRDGVRTNLKNHPLVREARAGEQGEGGDGVTVAKLISS